MAQLRRVAQYESTSTIELGKGFSSKVYKGKHILTQESIQRQDFLLFLR